MKLRFIYSLLVLGLIFSFVASVNVHTVSAQGDEEVLVDPGITPASPLHIFDRFGDWVRLNVFTFNAIRKAEIRARIVEERLAELKAVVEGGEGEAVINRAEALLAARAEAAEANLEALDNEGRDVSNLVDKFNDLSLRQQGVLDDVLARVPDQAKDVIERAIKRSYRGFERVSEVAVRQIEKGYLDEARAQEILERSFERLGRQIEKRSEALKKIADELGEVPPEVQELFEKKLQLLEGELFNVESKEEFKEIRDRIRSHLRETASNIREFRRIHRISDEGADEILKDIEKDRLDIPGKAAEIIAKAEKEITKLKRNIADAENRGIEIPENVSILLKNSEEHLARAKEAFDAKRYGEAFGQARAAYRNAKNGNRFFEVVGFDPDFRDKAKKIIDEAYPNRCIRD
ncbi:hypothetical protein IIA95_02935 [Patescibacteria group bacterium]|nr:hypothetical protein [Patescibacteria group bacterium]